MADSAANTTPTKEKTAWQQEADQRTKELTEKLENGVKELFDSDKYKDYLKAMSHFHNYSSRNIMLIHTQMPGATKVASFKLWKQFNRSPKRGETSLRIWAPIGKKEPETKLFEKLDPETKKPMLDKDGNKIMEELTAVSSLNMRFKLVPVFDVSQTVGEPLPQLAEDLTGNVEHYAAFLDTLKSISPLPIEFEALPPEQDGYCRFGEKIGIREGMSEIQTVSAIIHEITHARLHDKNIKAENAQPTAVVADGNEQAAPTKKSKDVKEIEAESVSYVVCQKYGIETGDNSFGYLASWSNHDMADFKASLDTIRKEANNIISAIDDRFAAICKERGIDLTAQEPVKPEQEQPQQSQPQQTPQKPEEPAFTTESTTQTIAGVDFTAHEVKPITPEKEQTTAVQDPIRDFLTDYYHYMLDTYRNGVPRDTPAQVESDITGLADILRNGKTDSFREDIERAGNNSGTQERAAALMQRLDEMFPQTAQLAEPTAALPEQTKSIEQQNYQKLAELFPKVANDEFLYQRMEAGATFMPLSLEWIDDNQLSIMHTYVQEGDLMYDPMIVFEVDHEAKTANAVEFQQSNPPLYQRIEDGIGHSIDGNGNERTIKNLQGQINDFATQWFENIGNQGYVPVQAVLRDSEYADATVFFNDEQKPFSLAFEYAIEGTTVLNFMDKDENGKPAKVAYVDSFRNVEFFEENLPKDVAAIVENVKLTNERTAQEKQAASEVSVPSEAAAPEAEQPASQASTEKATQDITELTDPMPDPTISITDMEAYGYSYENMLPLNQDRAVDLFDNHDCAVFLLYNDGTEAMVFDSAEILAHDGIFGVERDDWQRTEEYHVLVDTAEREAGQSIEAMLEADFINVKEDTFAIYQIMDGMEFTRDYRFEGMDYLEQRGLEVNRNHYVLVHTEPLAQDMTLDDIYHKYNDPPKDFSGHSLSVSDVIVLNKGGEITNHFVDRVGFEELLFFIDVGKIQEQSVQQTTPAVEQADSKVDSKTEADIEPYDASAEMAEYAQWQREQDFLGADPPGTIYPSASAEDMPDPSTFDIPSAPVYKADYKTALANDEQEDYDNSDTLNFECSQDIDKAIADNSKPGPMAGTQHVDIDKAARAVIEQYGPERVAWVLAGNVKAAENDGRFSSSTKEWAKSFDVPKVQTYHLNSHRTILESVINKFREIEKEKPSLMAALDKGEKRSKAEHGGITQPQKDSPDKSERKNNGER